MAAFFQSLHKTLLAGVAADPHHYSGRADQRGAFQGLMIEIGVWLALAMAFNVWLMIWPNQKKVLGLVNASADDKAAAARVAGVTSPSTPC